MAMPEMLLTAPETNGVTDDTIAPEAPSTFDEIGLSSDAVNQLFFKALYVGESGGTELADRLCLPYGQIEPFIEHGRAEHLIEVRGAAGTGTAGYRYALTDAGRDRARQFQSECSYSGPAPVPLDQYLRYVAAMRDSVGHIDRDRVVSGFKHLIVEDTMVDQLGPAISARKAIFLYGPPGNGKSVMGMGIGEVLGGDVYVPHALDVDGQVVALYDPVNHQRVDEEDTRALIRPSDAIDRRWVRIKRPVITVGGELTLDMLDLQFNALSRFYEAPIQLKSNCGVLVVDDFGRQRVPARDLLNRWVVPLEARIDYLTLTTGKKFEVPFDVLVVFATNLEPKSLADEAFLRRIPYKILARNPSLEQYTEIFRLNCSRQDMTFDPGFVDYLQREYYAKRGIDMRACHPRDLIDQVYNLCRYYGHPPAITEDLLDAACRCYFLDEPLPAQQTQARV